mmetsp:Transcript_29397/g.38679  ORF Transcript_29397/g.38679 Transcript_29397/m.38679 type:complete len:733 (+) Transcript_29397:88-2286(+)|eukprot:CAMPEP_0117757294 /NCGR_PEP_ID=MMETSP0947-20121206/14640_1 /TAXON_ID=44440 /ORGANISM="Chattonella subsalsa, Strain CCMP2191" /LENGTH=732 /DNA_ID=CAMNT_0005577149 /DNA_START=12 /DNA_END=2210 /DNA_ORIENTATION=-
MYSGQQQQQSSYGTAPQAQTASTSSQYGDSQQQQNYYGTQASTQSYQQPQQAQAQGQSSAYNYQQTQQQTSYAPAPAPAAYAVQTSEQPAYGQQTQQATYAQPQTVTATAYAQAQPQQQASDTYGQQQTTQQQTAYGQQQTATAYAQPTSQPAYGQDQQQQVTYTSPQPTPQQPQQQQAYQQYGPGAQAPPPQQQQSWGQPQPAQQAGYAPSQQPQPGQKRGYDQMQGGMNPNASGPPMYRVDEVPEGQDMVNILIPSDQVGLVIGKNGAIMKKIVKELQCKFALQEHHECPVGAKERILTLVGPIESLEEAEKIILDALQNKRGKDQEMLKWLFNADQVGLVIGRGGTTIKSIKETSGANLKIAHEQEMPAGSPERLLYITGSAEQVEKARQMVANKVSGRPFDGSTVGQETLIVPSRCVGYLLGPRASELKKITETAGGGVRINIALDAESATGDGTRKARFSNAPPENIAVAKQMLQERVDQWKMEQMGAVTEEVEVCLKLGIHQALIGHCIGKGGSFVRQINSSPNINMKILQEEPSRSLVQDLKPLVLNGPLANVLQAQRTLLDHLKGAPDHLKQAALQRATLPPPMMGGPPMGGGMMPPPFGGPPPMQFQQTAPYQQGYPPQQGPAFGGGGNYTIVEALRGAFGVLNIIQIPGGLEISVSAQIISKIVGQGGSTIRSLSTSSGCNIQAQKRETVLPGQMDRKVSVKGNPQQVEAMQHQLLQVLSQM